MTKAKNDAEDVVRNGGVADNGADTEDVSPPDTGDRNEYCSRSALL
jgi:hypothetical protein